MTSDGCRQCAANTYSGVGASGCTSCPSGKVSAAGSASCHQGKYLPIISEKSALSSFQLVGNLFPKNTEF